MFWGSTSVWNNTSVTTERFQLAAFQNVCLILFPFTFVTVSFLILSAHKACNLFSNFVHALATNTHHFDIIFEQVCMLLQLDFVLVFHQLNFIKMEWTLYGGYFRLLILFVRSYVRPWVQERMFELRQVSGLWFHFLVSPFLYSQNHKISTKVADQ